jgi:hypothetical protein
MNLNPSLSSMCTSEECNSGIKIVLAPTFCCYSTVLETLVAKPRFQNLGVATRDSPHMAVVFIEVGKNGAIRCTMG